MCNIQGNNFNILLGNANENGSLVNTIDNLSSNLSVHTIFGLILRSIFTNFSQTSSTKMLDDRVYVNSQSHLLVIKSQKIAYIQVELEKSTSLLKSESTTSQACRIIEIFKKFNLLNNFAGFHSQVTPIDKLGIQLRSQLCKEGGNVSTTEDTTSSRIRYKIKHFVEVEIPENRVVTFIKSSSQKIPTSLSSSILMASLTYAQDFLAKTGVSIGPDQFQRYVEFSRGLLNQDLSKVVSDEIRVAKNKTLTVFPFSNVIDDLPPILILLSKQPFDPAKHDLLDEHQIAKKMFPVTKANKIYFVFCTYKSEGAVKWETVEKSLKVNRGMIDFLWALMTKSVKDQFASKLVAEIIENNLERILKMAENSGERFFLLAHYLVSEFSALKSDTDRDLFVEKTISHKLLDNHKLPWYSLFVATSVNTNITLTVFLERGKYLESDSFVFDRSWHSLFYLQITLKGGSDLDANDHNASFPHTVKKSDIQTFFNLNIFGSTSLEFNELKLRVSIHTCLLDYDIFFAPTKWTLLSAAIQGLLETCYVNLQLSSLVEDKALTFVDETMATIITIDFLTVSDNFYDNKTMQKYINVMHKYRLAQEYENKYHNEVKHRISWVLLLTKPKSLRIFRRVATSEDRWPYEHDSASAANAFEIDIKPAVYQNMTILTNNSLVENNFPLKTYNILNSATHDLLAPNVLKDVLSRKLKIHAPTMSLVQNLLFVSNQTSFPVKNLIRHYLFSASTFYNTINTSTPDHIVNYLSNYNAEQEKCMKMLDWRFGISNKTVKLVTSRACVVDSAPFSAVQHGELVEKLENADRNLGKFDHFIHTVLTEPPSVVMYHILKGIGKQYTDVVVFNDSVCDRTNNSHQPQTVWLEYLNVAIKTHKSLCSSDSPWDILGSAPSGYSLASCDKTRVCVSSRHLSYQQKVQNYSDRNGVVVTSAIFVVNSTFSNILQSTLSNDVFLINNGFVSITGGPGNTTFTLYGQQTEGILVCSPAVKNESNKCTLDLRLYANQSANKNVFIKSFGDLTTVWVDDASSSTKSHLEIHYCSSIFDRKNLPDTVHIGPSSRVGVLHLHSDNNRRDKVSISRHFQGRLTLMLTGSKTILNWAKRSQFVYILTGREKHQQINLALSSESSRHIIVFDKRYRSVKSLTELAINSTLFTSRLFLVAGTVEGYGTTNDQSSIMIGKPVNAHVRFIFQTFHLELFGEFAFLKYQLMQPKSPAWYLPSYSTMQSFIDQKGVVHIAPFHSTNHIDRAEKNTVLVWTPSIFDTKINLTNGCENHIVFKVRLKHNRHLDLHYYSTVSLIKSNTFDDKITVVHFQHLASYAQNLPDCHLELTVSVETTVFLVVHVTLVSKRRTLVIFDLCIEWQEEKLDKLAFLLLARHPSVIEIVRKKSLETIGYSTMARLQPMPIHFDAQTELVLLIDSFLEANTKVVIDKQIGTQGDIKFLLVDSSDLLVLVDQLNPISVMLVNFDEPQSVLRTIKLKFNNMAIDLSEITV